MVLATIGLCFLQQHHLFLFQLLLVKYRLPLDLLHRLIVQSGTGDMRFPFTLSAF